MIVPSADFLSMDEFLQEDSLLIALNLINSKLEKEQIYTYNVSAYIKILLCENIYFSSYAFSFFLVV